MPRDCVVSIATRYGLNGPGIESRWGARFSAPVQTCPGAHPASYTMGTEFFPGLKRPGRGVGHRPPSSAKVEGRVELYICSPSWPSWLALGWTLPLPLPLLMPCMLSQPIYHPTYAFCDTPFIIYINSYMFHVSAERRHPREDTVTVTSQHASLGSAPPRRNDYSLKC